MRVLYRGASGFDGRQRFLLDPLREVFRELLRDPFRGTLAPFSRASLSPIAIACLRLVTRRPDRPLFSVPRFLRRIADSTRFEADLPYFAIAHTSALALASRSPLRNEEPGTYPPRLVCRMERGGRRR